MSKGYKLPIKPTICVVAINEQDYEFAAPSLKDLEKLTKAEKETKEPQAKVDLWRGLVFNALKKAHPELKDEDVKELDIPVIDALFGAIMESLGTKLEAKLGERKPL